MAKKLKTKTERAVAPKLDRVSTSKLFAELERREGQLEELSEHREQLAAELEAVDQEIAALSGSTPATPRRIGVGKRRPGRPRGGKRPHNEMTLPEAMAKGMGSKAMGVSDIADAVLASGYKTNAANFRVMVNQTLLKDKRFKKVERGIYRVK